MPVINKPSANTQIRNFLFVLFFGIASASLIVFMLVHYLGPSGKYIAKNVFLSPEIAYKMAYNDKNTKTWSDTRFVFQKLEFVYPDEVTGRWKSLVLNDEQYHRVYAILSPDVSILEPDKEIVHLFEKEDFASLILTVKTNSPAQWQAETKVFQEVQITINEKYYRIQLHEDESGTHWVYFYHPRLFEEIQQTLLK